MGKQLNFEEYLSQVLKDTQEAKNSLDKLEKSVNRLLSISDKNSMIYYLRQRGLSFNQIADEVGLSKSAVMAKYKQMNEVNNHDGQE